MAGPSLDPSLYRDRDLVRVKRALVSVSDKSGLIELAEALTEAGIEIVSADVRMAAQESRWGAEGHVFQQYHRLPDFPGPDGRPNRPVLGTWMVGDECFGVGIRESDGPVTDPLCRFVPNIIRN